MKRPASLTIALAACCLLASGPARAQEGGGRATGRPKVRFLAETILPGVSEVAVWAGEKGAGTAFTLPRTYLSDPQDVPSRAFLLVAAPNGTVPAVPQPGQPATPPPTLAKVDLPGEGEGFVVLLVPANPKQYRAVVIRVDDQKFRPGDVYLHNHTTATVLAKIGAKQFELAPGAGRIETPAPEGAKPYIDVAFGQRFEGQTRILNSTRWPVDNRNRGYVFFYFDAQGKRVTYRAVDEFVPPDEPKRDG